MLRIAPVTATSRLDDALTLSERFPATMAALTAGRITLCKARIIAEQAEQLSSEHAAAVEGRALGRATTQTPGQLRRAVRRAVNRADPAAVRRRHQAARRERGVSCWELPDGMAMISACLPAGEAVGVYGVLDEYAEPPAGPVTIARRTPAALMRWWTWCAGRRATPAPAPLPPRRPCPRRSAVGCGVTGRGSGSRFGSPSRLAPCSGSTSNPASWPATGPSPPTKPASSPRKAPGGASSPIRPPGRPPTTAPPCTGRPLRCATWS